MKVQCPQPRVQKALCFCVALWTALPLLAATDSETTNALPKLSPPYAELPPTFWEQHGNFATLAGLGVILLAGLVVWRCLRPKPKVILPPETQATYALDTLRGRAEDGALLSNVSQILRHYFIAAFRLSPGELTTAEFGRELSDQAQLGGELAGTVMDFLRRCDEQKFSPAKSATPFGAVEQALALVAQAEARRAQTQTSLRA